MCLLRSGQFMGFEETEVGTDRSGRLSSLMRVMGVSFEKDECERDHVEVCRFPGIFSA